MKETKCGIKRKERREESLELWMKRKEKRMGEMLRQIKIDETDVIKK